MGIAAYGITNDSGSIIPYQVETSEVVGMANITSLLAYNATAVNVGVQPYEATLQLNSMLVVKDANGSEYVYWPQNVMDFITNSSILALTDNVLNVTGDGAFLTNRSITSQNGGYVLACYPPKCEASQYYYGIYGNGPVMSYELPLHILLSISESVERGTGVLIQMGASFLQNGTISSTNGTIFDRITILTQTSNRVTSTFLGMRAPQWVQLAFMASTMTLNLFLAAEVTVPPPILKS